MSIEIKGLPPSLVKGSTEDTQMKRPADETVQKPESGESTKSDTVSLSENAVQLGKADGTAPVVPVVDTERVEAVKKAIADGSYEIDAEKIANKLMQFESILKSKE